MRKLNIILLLLFVCTAGCSSEDKAPMPKDELQEVLLDLHLAEAYSMMVTDSLHFLREKNQDSLAVFYNDVLKHHHISEKQLTEALDWYRQHPSEMDSVYVRMIGELGKYEAAYP